MLNGTNLLRVRDYNQQLVLNLIRLCNGASRVEIAERTGLAAQTVTNIVKRLLDDGLVVEADKVPRRGAAGSGASSFGSILMPATRSAFS